MSNSIENRPAEGEDPTGKKPWITFALLFVLTLGGAFAARLAADTSATDVNDSRNLARHAIRDAVHFTGRLDRSAVHVGGDGRVHLELVTVGAELPEQVHFRRPTDVIVVLDRSGSMSGDPMAKARAAIRELVSQLGSDDRFALVTYSNGADTQIPLGYASRGAQSNWSAQIQSIIAGGGTNMAAGLDQAHRLVTHSREAGRVARIVLLSDGHANQGDSSPEGLTRRSARAVGGEYVLSTVGVGEGFDERLMTRLADAGTGNFYYVPNVEVLAGIFSDEFESARQTVASALEIRIDTPNGVQVVDAAGYPIEKRAGFALIRPGSLFSGQERSFWVTMSVPATRAGSVELGSVRLAFTSPDSGTRKEIQLPSLPVIAAVVDESTFVASLDKKAVETHHAEEVVNRLRQSVSALVSKGDYAAAQERLDEVDFEELKDLGYAVEDTESYDEVKKMRDKVERAAAAPAAEQSKVRNQLGKSLFEAGTDGRRKGSKR